MNKNEKISESLKKHFEENGIHPNHKGHSFTNDDRRKGAQERSKSLLNEWLNGARGMPRNSGRAYILKEQDDKCNCCGGESIWNGAELKFQLNHIDGNNKNFKRSNLEMLCPNCHTQTHNWGFKNGGRGNRKY